MFKNLVMPFYLFRERLSAPRLERRPEPSAVTSAEDSVRAFHDAGAIGGSNFPLTYLNARVMSALLPAGGTVLDLGCGSAQQLGYLARCRADVRGLGLDLSEPMLALGRETLARDGLADRVELRLGDMTDFQRHAPERVDLISCTITLHHLPDRTHLEKCIREIAAVRRRTGCGVWLFDVVRPRHPGSPAYLASLDATAPPALQTDRLHSLIAAFTFDEVSALLDAADVGTFHHVHLGPWRNLQAHWIEPRRGADGQPAPWVEAPLPPPVRRQVSFFSKLVGKALPGYGAAAS